MWDLAFFMSAHTEKITIVYVAAAARFEIDGSKG